MGGINPVGHMDSSLRSRKRGRVVQIAHLRLEPLQLAASALRAASGSSSMRSARVAETVDVFSRP